MGRTVLYMLLSVMIKMRRVKQITEKIPRGGRSVIILIHGG